jgi:hypothetical protein
VLHGQPDENNMAIVMEDVVTNGVLQGYLYSGKLMFLNVATSDAG